MSTAMWRSIVVGGALLLWSAHAGAEVKSSRLDLPKGPGSIEGLASADVRPRLATGTASYSVPIELPPSARSFSPKLAFSYDSGGGVSELGIGWSLGGIPKLVRRTNEGIPRFDQSDVLGLVGLGTPSDLIEVAPGEFRPQYEDGSFLRVFRGPDGEQWEVRHKSGVRFLFGGKDHQESEGNKVASYLLREQVDLRGNRISYEWDTSGGYALLTRVIWNEFSKESLNEVVVHYEGRPDPSRIYSQGISQTLDRRVATVDVLHGGDLVRSYEVSYSGDAHPRLNALTLVGSDGKSRLPAAEFEYSGADLHSDGTSDSMELVRMDAPPPRSSADPNVGLLDLNGDAYPDLLVAEAGAYRSYINRDGRGYEPARNWERGDSPSVSLATEGVQLADVDGDGGVDMLAKSGVASFRYYSKPTETSFGSVTTIPTVPNITFEDAEVRLTDVDGDRRSDVIYTDPSGLYVAYNQKGADWALPEFVARIDAQQDVLFSSPDVELCDINGDKLKDICQLRSGSLVYYLGLGHGRFGPAERGRNVPTFSSNSRFRHKDLNGDGWDDLVRVGTGSVFYALAEGEGVYAAERRIDGVPEVSAGGHVEFADMNASGTVDILWIGEGETASWQYLELFPHGRAGLLARIENGLGKVQTLKYAPAAQFAAQDRAEGHPWDSRINVPLPVVSRIVIESGLEDPQMVTEFRYRNGIYDPKERTFAAFGVGITRALGDETTPTLVTEEHFDAGLEHRGLRGVTRFEEQRSATGWVFSRSTFDFRYTQSSKGLDGTSIDYGYRSSVFKEVVEGDEEGARTVLVEIEQDEFGNVIEERNWGETQGDDLSAGGDETITVRSYANNEQDWVLGRLAEEEVTDLDGNRLASKRNYYDGKAFEGLPLGKITRGDLTRQEEWVGPEAEHYELVTATKYDERGLPMETRDGRGGGRFFEWSDDQTSLLAETVKLESGVELTERAQVDGRFGSITSALTYNGQERRYRYDAFGRLTKVIEPGDTADFPTIEYRYEVAAPLSRVITLSRVISGDEYVERSESLFDGLGRKRGTLTKDGDRWVLAGVDVYDARGNAFRSVDPHWVDEKGHEEPDFFAEERSHLTWYDATGRTIGTRSPEGVASRTEYAVFEERHWDGGQADESSSYEHTPTVTLSDARGNVIAHRRVLDGEVLEAIYQRDPLGRLRGRRDPEGNEQRYDYDGRGRLVRLDDPDMGEHRMAYDPAGNLLTHRHPDGATTDFTYDLADRVLTEDWDGDGEIEVSYDYDEGQGELGLGRLLRVEEPTGFVEHEYDERGQVVQTEYNIEGESYVVASEYDAQGRERVHVYPDGSRIELKRNARGQLSGYGDLVRMEYRGDGLETLRRFNTGVEFKNRYDEDQRRRELEVLGHDGRTIEHLEWDFDDGGNLLGIEDLRPDVSDEKDRSEAYTYDNLYRLTGASGSWGNTEWAYSHSGNLLKRKSTVKAQDAPAIEYGRRPHAPQKFGSQKIEYDQRGRMLFDGQREYTWNGTDQLVRVQKGEDWVESEYGLDGVRRVRREHTKAGTKVTHFIDAWSEVKDGELERYVVHAEKRIVRLGSNEERKLSLSEEKLRPVVPLTDRKRGPGAGSHQRTRATDSLSVPDAQGLGGLFLIACLFLIALVRRGLSQLGSLRGRLRRQVAPALLFVAGLTLAACSAPGSSRDAEDVSTESGARGADGEWIRQLTPADTIFLSDLVDSSMGQTDGEGKRKAEVALYPYGFARYDDSHETNVYADTPRDRNVGLDHMGSRFYAPNLGVWTSADPAILTTPEQYVTAEFGAANPYAYANLRPVVAADRDGQFWHIAGGAAVGALIGGVTEAVTQYATNGKVEDWGRVGAAAAGGAVAGAVTAANPGAGLATVMGSAAASNAAGGVATRLIESGGKSAGTATDVLVDATVGAATAGVVKGGSSLLRKVLSKKPPQPPANRGTVGEVGPSPYSGVKQASAELKARGVPRADRKQVLESFDVRTLGVKAAGESQFGLRYFDNVNAFEKGRYLFHNFPASRGSLALKPSWNQMTDVAQFQIRPGATYLEGQAASQGAGLPGGQMQMFMLDLGDLL